MRWSRVVAAACLVGSLWSLFYLLRDDRRTSGTAATAGSGILSGLTTQSEEPRPSNQTKHLHDPPPSTVTSVGVASPIPQPRRVIIVHNLPLWDERGGDYQVYTTILALLRLNFEVTYIYPYNYVTSPNSIDLNKLGVRVIAGTSIHQMLLFIENHHYDVVIEFLWFNPDYMAYLRALNSIVKDMNPNTKIVVVNPDIIHIRLYEEVSARNPKCMECLDWKETELYFWNLADVVAGVNENLNKITRQLVPSARVVLLPYCQLDIPTKQNYSFSQRSGVVFFGSQNPSNAASFRWLQEGLVPRLHKLFKTNLVVYGRVYKKRRGPIDGLFTFGPATVAELNDGIMRARWMLAPVFSNVGVSTKVVRSLALGTPVVTTASGTGGMESITEPLPMVIADKSNFTEVVLSVYENESLWNDLHSRSREFINRYFGLGYLVQHVSHLMDTAYSLNITHVTPAVLRDKLHVAWEVANSSTGSMTEILKVFPYLENVQSEHVSRCSSTSSFDVYVRLMPPYDFSRPSCCKRDSCKFIAYFPLEYGYLPIRWKKQIEENVDVVWMMSRYYVSMLKNNGVNSDIIRAVPFGIDCDVLNVKNRDIRADLKIQKKVKIFGYVGRGLVSFVVPEMFKIFLELLKKDEIYNKGKKDVLLMIVLPPDYKQKSPLPSHPKVMFIPYAKYDIGDLYRAFDFLLHPLGSEWSMAPVEVLSQGKTVLTGFKGVMADYLTETDFAQLILYSQHWSCKTSPCDGKSLCIFSETDKEKCEELVFDPVLLGVPSRRVRTRMERVLTHPHLDQKGGERAAKQFACESYSWRQIAKIVSHELRRSRAGIVGQGSSWADESIIPNMLQYELNSEAYGS